jgi:hypothetical protein
MKKTFKTGITAILLGTMILQGGIPVLAENTEATVVSAPTNNYGLTPDIRTAVKSIAAEATPQGVQLSATVRLYNGGSVMGRVPEHELRVRTVDGVAYTLKPSASNKKTLQPKEISELVYMSTVEGFEQIQLDQLSFVEVDMYTYPKTETNLLTVPLGSQVWYETGGISTQDLESVAWQQSFSLPGVNSGIVYTPVGLSEQNTADGPVKLVTLIAENPGVGRETIPNFRIDGLSEQKSYDGQRTSQESIALQPGEKTYIHYAIPVENGAALTRLLVATTDVFVPAGGGQPSVLATGKLDIALPKGNNADVVAAAAYTIGKPIAFDPMSKLVDKKTEVSLMELHLHENPEAGYKTAIAKFKLTNKSDMPIPFPGFQTELTNGQGITYSGARQTGVTSTMNPGLSYVVSYSFQLPQAEDGEKLTLKLLDPKLAAPYTASIAAVATAVQPQGNEDTFSLYPYDVKLNNYAVSYNYSAAANLYNYIIRLDLGLTQQENVVVDENFSKLRIEVTDNLGRVVGTSDASFTGPKKLISGDQKINASNISSDEFTSPIHINIYELIQTPGGEAKRLLKTFKQ